MSAEKELLHFHILLCLISKLANSRRGLYCQLVAQFCKTIINVARG